VIDGIAFDYRGEPRCRVCAAAEREDLLGGPEVRRLIDSLLVMGWTYADILRRIEPEMADWPKFRRPSYSSIRRHQLRHLPADDTATRAIIERRAIERGLKVVVGRGPLVTQAGILELVQQRGFEAIALGDLVPSVKETLEAARALEEIDQEAGSGLSISKLAQQVGTFIEVIKGRMSPEEFSGIVDEVAERLSPSPAELPTATSPTVAGSREEKNRG
jgi:hypothetical protein